MGGHTKFGVWIMATGLMLGTGLFLMAVLDIDPWKDPGYNHAPPITADAPSPHRGERNRRACSSCHPIINPQRDLAIPFVPAIVSGTMSPHSDGREHQACSKCHRILARPVTPATPGITPGSAASARPQGVPIAMTVPVLQRTAPAIPQNSEWHEQFRTTRFQGKIMAVAGRDPRTGRNNVNILIDDGVNPSWYNLAPEWYLKEKKCMVASGFYAKGTAFQELGQTRSLRYGQSLSINGQLCQLRNSHMEGLWNPTTRRHGNEEADSE
ncbi:MAG: magnetochrome domain-containing protein [Magnetococcales bacterium]|nr:magnetochrome domain-containing protein [Magnetococcales bacterium]